MRLLTALSTALIAASLSAQQSLIVNPAGFPTGYVWTYSAPGANYYNLHVTNTITLQALRVPTFSPAGTVGSVNFWMTDGLTPATQTHVGNETNAAAWTLMASGEYKANGAATLYTSCMEPGVVIQPGDYGICIESVGVWTEWVAMVPGTQVPFSDANISIDGGVTQYDNGFLYAVGQITIPAGPTWASQAVDQQSRVQIFYEVGSVAHSCSALSYYGEGCYQKSFSPYQRFDDAAPASTALQGNSISFIPNPSGTGYTVVSPAVSLEGGYVVPGTLLGSLGLQQLPAGDDGENIINTAATPVFFPTPTGLQFLNQFWVHDNGFISVDADGDLNGSNNTLSGANYTPVVGPFLSAPNTGWWSWHDFNATEAGSGVINWEENGGTICVTYLDMESYPDAVANQSTVQFQFDVTGIVSIFWPTVDAAGGSPFFGGDATLVGFSPGGAPSPDGGAFDIAALIGGAQPAYDFPEKFPLRLDVTALPKLGANVDFVVSSESTNPGLGLIFLSTGQIPAPGFPLAGIGAPDCSALIDPTTGVNVLIGNFAPYQMNFTLAIPVAPNLVGAHIYGQGVWLDPLANTLGVTTSNGADLRFGLF